MHAQMVVFFAPKRGNDEWEWEDGAAGFLGDTATGRLPRFAVADGATEGFGSARWAQHLVTGFVGLGGPDGRTAPPVLAPDALHRWLALTQTRWHEDPCTAGASDLERLKLTRVGSFATLLGCELRGLEGPKPRWDAVAWGDTVLFHVRGHHVVAQFPLIAAEDFGVNPDGVSTKPERLPAAVSRLLRGGGPLAVGERLYLATDALAQWMVATHQRESESLWDALAALDHPATFRRLVADRRRAGEMANDDVTLMRVHLAATPPTSLVVCQ